MARRSVKLYRQEQMKFLVMGLFPGVLVLLKILAPQQALLLLMVTYFMSRLHASRMQKQFDEEEKAKAQAEEERCREEERALLALPARKRKNILKGITKKEQAEKEEQVVGEAQAETRKDK